MKALYTNYIFTFYEGSGLLVLYMMFSVYETYTFIVVLIVYTTHNHVIYNLLYKMFYIRSNTLFNKAKPW